MSPPPTNEYPAPWHHIAGLPHQTTASCAATQHRSPYFFACELVAARTGAAQRATALLSEPLEPVEPAFVLRPTNTYGGSKMSSSQIAKAAVLAVTLGLAGGTQAAPISPFSAMAGSW